MVVFRIWRSGVAWQRGEMSRTGFITLMYIPGLTLGLDELRQGFGISDAFLTQVGISTNSAVDIVNGLAMPSDPDLSRCKVEV